MNNGIESLSGKDEKWKVYEQWHDFSTMFLSLLKAIGSLFFDNNYL